MKSILCTTLTIVLSLTFIACGGGNTDDAEPTTSEGSVDVVGSVFEETIRPVGDEMKYDTDSIYVSAGAEVTLTLENIATLPTMVHNVVVLTSNSDDDANRIGMAAIAAGEAQGYLPEDTAILAATPMAQPGETVNISFTAPAEPGLYRFICTYPGHYSLMKGVLVVS